MEAGNNESPKVIKVVIGPETVNKFKKTKELPQFEKLFDEVIRHPKNLKKTKEGVPLSENS